MLYTGWVYERCNLHTLMWLNCARTRILCWLAASTHLMPPTPNPRPQVFSHPHFKLDDSAHHHTVAATCHHVVHSLLKTDADRPARCVWGF